MKRCQFEQIAKIIKYMDMLDYNSKAFVAYRFANELKQTNLHFNKDKFLRACGVDKLL